MFVNSEVHACACACLGDVSDFVHLRHQGYHHTPRVRPFPFLPPLSHCLHCVLVSSACTCVCFQGAPKLVCVCVCICVRVCVCVVCTGLFERPAARPHKGPYSKWMPGSPRRIIRFYLHFLCELSNYTGKTNHSPRASPEPSPNDVIFLRKPCMN